MAKSFKDRLKEASSSIKKTDTPENHPEDDPEAEDRSYLPKVVNRQYRRPNSTIFKYVCSICEKHFESPVVYGSFGNPKCNNCERK